MLPTLPEIHRDSGQYRSVEVNINDGQSEPDYLNVCSTARMVLEESCFDIREEKRKDQSIFFLGHEGSYPATVAQRKVHKQEVKFWFLYLSNE